MCRQYCKERREREWMRFSLMLVWPSQSEEKMSRDWTVSVFFKCVAYLALFVGNLRLCSVLYRLRYLPFFMHTYAHMYNGGEGGGLGWLRLRLTEPEWGFERVS